MLTALRLRTATLDDCDAMVGLGTGPVAGRRDFIRESIERRVVSVALDDALVVGYSIWDRAFFGRPFVWLLAVDSAWRRRGVATQLLLTFEQECSGESLFTSTNQSNGAMQAVLGAAGYRPSGAVENIDPGDPELFFHKVARLRCD